MSDIIEISDYSNNLMYILNLESRITIITGDSATGKSTLIRYIENYNKDSYNSIKIESEKELIHLTPVMVRNKFELSEDAIYFMDEGDNVKSKEYFTLVNDTRYKFVIITRDTSYPSISYDVDDIYEIQHIRNKNQLVRIYKNNYNTNKLSPAVNNICTEDEKSGYEFYKLLDNYNVSNSRGSSRVPYKIQKSKNSIFIVDSLGFGPYIKRSLLNLDNNNNILIAPKSFEYLILCSLFELSIDELQNLCNSYRNQNHESGKFNINDENIFYKILIDKCSNLGFNYNKSSLPNWLVDQRKVDLVIDNISKMYNLTLDRNNRVNDEHDSNNLFKWE